MQNSTQDRELEVLLSHYKSIPFKASTLTLWDRSTQGKTIGIRGQSMLPQITLSSDVLFSLVQTKIAKAGLAPALKLSSTHYLSLICEDCLWTEGLSPSGDLLIYIRGTSRQKIIDHLNHDDRMLDFFYQSLDRLNFCHQTLEALDFYKVMLMYSKDKYSNKLLLRSEILFPHTNLLFAPLNNHKLVSCPLTKRLIQKTEAFERGYLTMDQNSRVVPLEISDPMVLKYPVIGIWTKNVPQTNSASKAVNLVHPLVWAACMQYILNKDFIEKVSPNPAGCSFLFIDFSDKVKFFEVSCQKVPAWKTTAFSAELTITKDRQEIHPLVIQYLKKDTRNLLKNAVGHLEVHSKSVSRSGTPPTAKPPMHKVQKTSDSAKDILRTRSYDKIIVEQTKLIEKLQAKVQKLQIQVSPKSKSYTEHTDHSDSFKNSIETNTTVSMMEKAKPQRKINFDVEEKVDKNFVYSSQMLAKPIFNQRESLRDSSDEEKFKLIQRLYLSNKK